MLTNVNNQFQGDIDDEQFNMIIQTVIIDGYQNEDLLEDLMLLLDFGTLEKKKTDNGLDLWEKFGYVDNDNNVLASIVISDDKTKMNIGIYPADAIEKEYNITSIVMGATPELFETKVPKLKLGQK